MAAKQHIDDDILISLCCGDRCLAAIEGDGVCERWAYKEQAAAALAEADKEASALLAKISERQASSR